MPYTGYNVVPGANLRCCRSQAEIATMDNPGRLSSPSERESASHPRRPEFGRFGGTQPDPLPGNNSFRRPSCLAMLRAWRTGVASHVPESDSNA